MRSVYTKVIFYNKTDLVYGDSIDICVVNKPDDLIGEELAIVLGG